MTGAERTDHHRDRRVAVVVGVLLAAFVFGGADQYLGALPVKLWPAGIDVTWATDVSLLSAPWLLLAFTFLVDGAPVFRDTGKPFEFSYPVPSSATALTFSAVARDYGANEAISEPVDVSVVPDPPPTVEIVTPAEGATVTGGSFIPLQASPADNSAVARVIFAVNEAPRAGTRGTYRVKLRHGVSEVRDGERFTLGVIFHDAM